MSYNLIQCSCGCIYAEADGHNCNKVSDAYRIEELEAKLAAAELVARYETDVAQQAIDQMKAEKGRAEAAEAALPAVYRLALENAATACDKERDEARANYCPTQAVGAVWSAKAIRALPTPTAAELMARIHTGEKE